MFLVDTNVVSEMRKIKSGVANPGLAGWAGAVKADELYLSVVTVQELEVGVLRLEKRDTTQGAALRKWLDQQVLPGFSGRILPIDERVALYSAQLQVPNPRPILDGLIAATAIVHGLTLVTRNIADFQTTGARMLNPWT